MSGAVFHPFSLLQYLMKRKGHLGSITYGMRGSLVRIIHHETPDIPFQRHPEIRMMPEANVTLKAQGCLRRKSQRLAASSMQLSESSSNLP